MEPHRRNECTDLNKWIGVSAWRRQGMTRQGHEGPVPADSLLTTYVQQQLLRGSYGRRTLRDALADLTCGVLDPLRDDWLVLDVQDPSDLERRAILLSRKVSRKHQNFHKRVEQAFEAIATVA